VHSLCLKMMADQDDSSGEDADNDDRKVRQVRVEDQRAIFAACRATMVNGRVQRGIFKKFAKQLRFERNTISRQWRRMETSLHTLLNNHPEEEHDAIIQQNSHILFVVKHCDRRKGKYKYDRQQLRANIRSIPYKERRTHRLLASKLKMPLTTVHWLVRDRPQGPRLLYGGAILKPHRSSLKPKLTNGNKLHRLLFCMSQLKSSSLNLRNPVFEDQMDRVYVDEKWFWLCKDGERYLLLEGEMPPKRYVRHKSHIEKVMFLCAQARPRYDPHAHTMWDGKLGIWPIGTFELALRSSVNRPAGTAIWKNCTMDKDRYREMMNEEVFPAIIAKWPRGEWSDPNFRIKIQQDNAPAHPAPDDDFIDDVLRELEGNGIITPGKLSI
jgi:hypothetical protein